MWKIKRGHWKLLEFLCVFVLQFEELIILKEGNFFFKKKQLLWWHLGICFNGLIFVCTFFLRPFKDLGLRYWKLVISFIFVTLSVLLPNQGSTSKAIHIMLWKTFGLEATSWNCRTLGCCGPFKRSVGVQRAIEGGAGNSDSGASVPAPGGGGSQQLTCQCGWLTLATGYSCWSCTDFRVRPPPARVA